jgi:aspartyl/asparaginyl beta-hydroxylase (cupin superfamily)
MAMRFEPVTSETVASLIELADRAARFEDFAEAQWYLEKLVILAPSVENWLKLGAICRASGALTIALGAVEQALTLDPLDFMALLSRASLLERLEDREAGEAYGRALARRPGGALPSSVKQALAHAEEVHLASRDEREAGLVAAMKIALSRASSDEVMRMNRFRSNAVRRTRVWHSEPTHFHYPGLAEREFHDPANFPWLGSLESATSIIAAEFTAVANAERAELVPYIQYAEHEPLAQWRDLNHSRDWTAIHLVQNGVTVMANARHCPETMRLLERLQQPGIAGCSPNAMFSVLAPRTRIPAHTGVTNTRLVCHLPLIVPDGCWFRVGAETRRWEVGKAWVFDDTIEHEADNPSDEVRIILIVDLWHPGLNAIEREAVKLLMEADVGSAALAL